MKILKTSLLASMMLGAIYSSASAESLSEALTNGDFKGEFRAYYFDAHKPNSSGSADLLTFGLNLNYVTKDYKGFKLGTTVQTSDSPYASEEAKKEFGKPYDMYGSGAVLSEAYLSYAFDKTEIKIGRQILDLPIMRRNGSRVVYQSYEGASIVNKNISDTTLALSYVTKVQNKTDGSGNIGEFEDFANGGDYAYAVSAVNKSIKGLKLIGAYGEQDKNYNLTFLQSEYKNRINDFSYSLGLQYLDTNYDSENVNDATLSGVKVGFGYKNFKLYTAYTQLKDGTTMTDVAGGGSDLNIFTATVTHGGRRFASDQFAIDAKYFAKNMGLILGARYVNIDNKKEAPALFANTKEDYTSVYGIYKFKGALKNLKLVVQYEQKDSDKDTNDIDNFRIRTIYKF